VDEWALGARGEAACGCQDCAEYLGDDGAQAQKMFDVCAVDKGLYLCDSIGRSVRLKHGGEDAWYMFSTVSALVCLQHKASVDLF